MNELLEFFGVPVVREIAGRRIEIREMDVEQTARFLAQMTPLTDDLAAGTLGMSTVLRNAPAIVEAVVIALGLERAWISALPARLLLPLVDGVLEANAAFFVEALPTFATGLAARIEKMADGLTRSNT